MIAKPPPKKRNVQPKAPVSYERRQELYNGYLASIDAQMDADLATLNEQLKSASEEQARSLKFAMEEKYVGFKFCTITCRDGEALPGQYFVPNKGSIMSILLRKERQRMKDEK